MADVLIVDEDPEVRTMLGWFLAIQGHEVRGAGSAAEALDAITAQVPDAVVLDLDLPDMPGHDLLAVVRTHGLAHGAAVVVLSDNTEPSDLVRSWELGVNTQLAKPVAPEVVADAVALHLAPRPLALAG